MDSSLLRIMIADDHPMMLDGIAGTLTAQGGFEIVARAENGEQAITLYDTHRPEVALIDLQMPGKDGIETIREIRSRHADAQLIVLTTYQGDARIAAALKAGAQAYLMKSVSGQQLASTIRDVHNRCHVLPQAMRQEIAAQYLGNLPSQRELDVLRLAASGAGNREIAAALLISEATVKAHMSAVLLKLGASDRAHAVALAARRGFIEI